MKTQTMSHIELSKLELTQLLLEAEKMQENQRDTVNLGGENSVSVCIDCFLKRANGIPQKTEDHYL